MSHSFNSEPHKVAERRNLWAVVDLFVFGLFAMAMLAMLIALTPLDKIPVIYAIPLQALFNVAVVGFTAGWIRITRGIPFTEYIHFFRTNTFSMRSMIILGLASALSVLFIAPLLPSNGPSPLEKQLTTRSAILMFAVFGVAVAPLFEEVIFRGFLFKVLWEIGGSKLAVPGSAVLFAGTHAPQLGENWYAVLLIFLVGLILAVVRQRSNSVIPSFIIHTSYNGAIFVLFALGTLLQKSTR